MEENNIVKIQGLKKKYIEIECDKGLYHLKD